MVYEFHNLPTDSEALTSGSGKHPARSWNARKLKLTELRETLQRTLQRVHQEFEDLPTDSKALASRPDQHDSPEETRGTPWHNLIIRLRDECNCVWRLTRQEPDKWAEIGRVISRLYNRKAGRLKSTTSRGEAGNILADCFRTQRVEAAPWLINQILEKLQPPVVDQNGTTEPDQKERRSRPPTESPPHDHPPPKVRRVVESRSLNALVSPPEHVSTPPPAADTSLSTAKRGKLIIWPPPPTVQPGPVEPDLQLPPNKFPRQEEAFMLAKQSPPPTSSYRSQRESGSVPRYQPYAPTGIRSRPLAGSARVESGLPTAQSYTPYREIEHPTPYVHYKQSQPKLS